MAERIRHLIGYNRLPLSIFLGGAFFFLSSPSAFSLAAGIPFVLLGEALRVWSSGYLDKNVVLQTNGPYSITRNPLYLGNFLIGFGFALIGNSMNAGLLLIGGLSLIYIATILEEEKYLTQRFGRMYDVYARQVPRFFPRWSRPQKGEFRWERVLAHREMNTWVGIIGGILLFLAKWMWI